MRRTKPLRCWRWRCRSNPLRRRDDIVETWIILAMWVVISLGGALVGVITAQAAEASFAQLRHDRHPARVVLVESTTRAMQTEEGNTNRPVDSGQRKIQVGGHLGSWLPDSSSPWLLRHSRQFRTAVPNR
ncbi:hypothetical protein [Streptomyces sp. NPDC017964]|uniref:hypothetical protein n=1 Tax=Streptomyces sp. NPDC017964 TaxID=3365022 RepID=UPI00379FF815